MKRKLATIPQLNRGMVAVCSRLLIYAHVCGRKAVIILKRMVPTRTFYSLRYNAEYSIDS